MDAEQLIEMIEGAGYDARSYSGRGMYGKECVGVSMDSELVFFADLLDVAESDEVSEIIELMRSNNLDQLGRGVILYWPWIEWPQEELEETAE